MSPSLKSPSISSVDLVTYLHELLMTLPPIYCVLKVLFHLPLMWYFALITTLSHDSYKHDMLMHCCLSELYKINAIENLIVSV